MHTRTTSRARTPPGSSCLSKPKQPPRSHWGGGGELGECKGTRLPTCQAGGTQAHKGDQRRPLLPHAKHAQAAAQIGDSPSTACKPKVTGPRKQARSKEAQPGGKGACSTHTGAARNHLTEAAQQVAPPHCCGRQTDILQQGTDTGHEAPRPRPETVQQGAGT